MLLGLPPNYDLSKRNWFKEIKDRICSEFQGLRTKVPSQFYFALISGNNSIKLHNFRFLFSKSDFHAIKMLFRSLFWCLMIRKKKTYHYWHGIRLQNQKERVDWDLDL